MKAAVAPRRGLTLLEIMIAIGLLVAVAAIALPAVVGSIGRRAFETGGEVLIGQLLLARAHAQLTARPVQVSYRSQPPRLEARWFDPEGPGPGEVPPPATAPERRAEGIAGDAGPPLLPTSWARRDLPGGVRVTDLAPAGEDRALALLDAARPAGMDDRPEADGPPAPGPLPLAVFLADGSAILGGSRWLVDDEGRSAALRVNPWTGLARLEPASAAAPPPDEGGGPEADEPPENEPPAGRDRPSTRPAGGAAGQAGSAEGEGGRL